MTFLLVLLGWTLSLSVHEFAHALVAYLGGDTTVREKGYLTFNPLRYTHPVYSLLMPLLFLLIGGLGLPGGAVYIEYWRLRSRRWMSAVSLAGPSMNLLMAAVLALVLRLAPAAGGGVWPAIAFLALLQVSGAILNLIPIPPLDGYGVISAYLDPELKHKLDEAGKWALWVFFLVLWYLPLASRGFWTLVYGVARGMGIPLDLAIQGLYGFQFWIRRQLSWLKGFAPNWSGDEARKRASSTPG